MGKKTRAAYQQCVAHPYDDDICRRAQRIPPSRAIRHKVGVWSALERTIINPHPLTHVDIAKERKYHEDDDGKHIGDVEDPLPEVHGRMLPQKDDCEQTNGCVDSWNHRISWVEP